MKVKELRAKTHNELNKLLRESENKLAELRFKVSQRQLKNVRDMRKVKLTISRIKTILHQQNQPIKQQ